MKYRINTAINSSNNSQKSMDTGLENTVVENKETGESTKTDEYMSD